MKTKNPVLVIIRDGWGYKKSKKWNAIAEAKTPNYDKFLKKYPHTLLGASGEAVGLPRGYQGNSEIGHLTIGSGRIILQPMVRINNSIKDGSFFKVPEFLKAIENCKTKKSSLHIIGLLQTQGVHSHINHLFALLDLCKKRNFKNVNIHIITDGRDAPVMESEKHIKSLIGKIKKTGVGKIATISGRYYAMDRDKRWKRTKRAYDCIVEGKGKSFQNALAQIKESHKNGETDEFIIPKKLKSYEGIKNGDSVIFFNFRTDRPRQLTKAIVENKFPEWRRKKKNVYFVAITEYYKGMNAHTAFKNQIHKNLLGEILSKSGLKQLRISETEKYAHVTYFLNGQKEKPAKNETRILINSPKIPTYDLKPEMSVFKISKKLVSEIKKRKYEFIAVNLVNCDMVGHTGKKRAILKAVGSVDKAQGEIVKTALREGYTIMLLADHGNAEDYTKKWGTSHTTNPVPFVLISEKLKNKKLKKGGLRDVSPTILNILGIKKPKEMTGKSLI